MSTIWQATAAYLGRCAPGRRNECRAPIGFIYAQDTNLHTHVSRIYESMSGNRGNDFIDGTDTVMNGCANVMQCSLLHAYLFDSSGRPCSRIHPSIKIRGRVHAIFARERERERKKERFNQDRWHFEWRCGRFLARNWRRFTVKNRRHLFVRSAVP